MRLTGMFLIATVAVLIFRCETTQGATWYVDGSVSSSGDGTSWETAFRTVQEGIGVAEEEDTVIVAAGTYLENIRFRDENVVLRSTDPLDPEVMSRTILDGNQSGVVVTFGGKENRSCVLEGFMIQNGKGVRGGGICGGTWPVLARPTIRNNIIRGNFAERMAGGLYGCHGPICDNIIVGNFSYKVEEEYSGCGGGLSNCDGLIVSNTIASNSAEGNGGGLHGCDGTIENNCISGNRAEYGGGLAFCDGMIQDNTVVSNAASYEGGGFAFCDGTIQNNIVSANSASNDEGGGIGYCDGTIRGNTITGNSADYGGGVSYCLGEVVDNFISGNTALRGGGLTFCNGTVRNNRIEGNYAKRNGAGLHYCDGTIDGNVIRENVAQFAGGGLSKCSAVIQNNLIVANCAGSSGGGLVSCVGPIQSNTVVANTAFESGGGMEGCQGTIGNCIIWGNAAPENPQVSLCSELVYCCIEAWGGTGEGNFIQEPCFVDAAEGDYHLRAESPCVDAGANYFWFAWPQRDVEGNCRLLGERIDVGCYEHGGAPDTDGDLLYDGAEVAAGTDPTREDTDEDGLRDGLELLRGSDPRSPTPPRVVPVPADIARVQAALLLAVSGEEIVVAPGTYRENLHFCGASVILRGSEPRDRDVVSATILQGDETGPVVSFTGSESEACVLSGFTITGGRTDSGGGIRGGASGRYTHATIEHNIITGNYVTRKGGGLCECDGVIQNNTVADNYAARHGGGLAYCNGSIRGNVISDNRAGGCGGGLYRCGGVIERNTITANTAEGTFVWRGTVLGEGGAMSWCDGTIRNNQVTGNRALNGGGLHMCCGMVVNNTIFGNEAELDGGGMYSCTANLIGNCIIWGNVAGSGPQLLDCSCPRYSCVGGWEGEGEGNICQDPRFVDVGNGDFRLLPGSPCIDAGFNDPELPETDIRGRRRIVHGGKGQCVDMGAYEYCINRLEVGPHPEEMTLTWSSVGGKFYVVFWSDNLVTWHPARVLPTTPEVDGSGGALPDSDMTTSWTDDGSDTAVPPSAIRHRFYQVWESGE